MNAAGPPQGAQKGGPELEAAAKAWCGKLFVIATAGVAFLSAILTFVGPVALP